jgi:flagellar M-ring protein FliF
MPWVENAIVLYDEHESRGLRQVTPTTQITASVSVKPIAGEILTPLRAKKIQKLVACSVNMKPSDVGVTNLGESGPAGTEGEFGPDSIDDEYLKTKVTFESQKRESIMGALRDIPGVRVEVNADLNDTVEETTHTAKPDPKTAAKTETSTTEETTSSSPDNGGQPGQTSQGPNRQVATQSTPTQPQNRTHNESTRTDNVVGIEDSRVVKKGYTPKEVWATVSIPGSYIKNLWAARNPTATAPPKPDDLSPVWAEVKPNVENLVNQLLILQANKGGNEYKHVQVVMLDSLPMPTIEAPSMASKAVAWTGRYWSTLGMLGVAMFSLLVLRSVVNGKPSDSASATPASASSLALHAEEPKAGADSGEAAEAGRPKLRLKKGTSVKDDLVEIVREDPDAAADILRSWISKAG